MFAVVKTGGKQYRVAVDDVLEIEKLAAEEGEAVEFDQVLMLGGDSVTVGAPLVSGASVKGEVLSQFRGPKVLSFVKRRRKHSSKRLRGHRQSLTRVRITDIVTGGAKKAKAAQAEEGPAEAAAESGA